jgi:hypothetical protein
MSEERNERLDPALEREIARLPREIEPDEDLWPGIRNRLQAETASTRRGRPDTWRWLAAAAVVLVVVGSLAFGLRQDGDGARLDLPRPIASNGGSPDAAPASWGGSEPSAVEVLAALEERADELDPRTVETIRENLQVIDDALEEIRIALEEDPSNARLTGMWNTGVKRRGEVLRKAAVLAGSI